MKYFTQSSGVYAVILVALCALMAYACSFTVVALIPGMFGILTIMSYMDDVWNI
jgi:hypothetical protein